MPSTRIIVVTGLPGSGKTTLAREIASRYRVPLIAKDLIKEPLMNVLGAAQAAESRRLSNASFAVLFALARELADAGVDPIVVEGNFRSGEHEPGFAGLGSTRRLMQILCRVPEQERAARIDARAAEGSRHQGHALGERLSLAAGTGATDRFLAVSSGQLIYDGTDTQTVLEAIDDWMKLSAPSP